MNNRTKVITMKFEYIEYRPGDIVTPTSTKSSLEMGTNYKVDKFFAPYFEEGDLHGMVWVEGRRYGVSCEYLKLVTPVEDTIDNAA